ncbi:hypothetical protein Athai_45470 [Actinocatenispora thailandica]|uniref:Uncharacterized protein n=1 Tax=Actinocatenispora thailandica TaxID=227318 RepID=A0A7R7DSM4_9ACTN|nr:hypothetical protein [Actinocatenispora thailandica]BCJ37044.1 hypothetical protein Athai_45470 [Actinocatenispora thailandica]
MGVRAWWQRLWRRWRRPEHDAATIGEVRSRGKEQLAKYDTRFRGGSPM